MPIFTAYPSKFEHVQINRTGNSVTVKTGFEGNSRICITSHELDMGFQEVAENVSSHTFHDVPENFHVTITAPNYIPYCYMSNLATGVEKDDPFSIRIYPNPTNGHITVNAPGLEFYSAIITSLNGRILQSIDAAESELKLDLSNFSKGVYFITVRSRNFVSTERIIKL
jgi:hypothetical protein